MKILSGNNGNVDFDGPVEMTDEQRTLFFDFMRSMFSVVQEEPTDQVRYDRIGDKLFSRPWDQEEYDVLLEIEDTEGLSEMLGRTWMSGDIKRGDFFPMFMLWIDRKGKDILKDDIKELIHDFMAEKENEKLKKKAHKQFISKKEKEIKNLEGQIEFWRSSKHRYQLELQKKLCNEEIKDVDEFIEDQVQKIQDRINKILIDLGKI